MGKNLSSKYGQKLLDKITSVSTKLSSAELRSQNNEANDELEVPKEIYISQKKKDNKLLMN